MSGLGRELLGRLFGRGKFIHAVFLVQLGTWEGISVLIAFFLEDAVVLHPFL